MVWKHGMPAVRILFLLSHHHPLKMLLLVLAARRRRMRHPPPELWELIAQRVPGIMTSIRYGSTMYLQNKTNHARRPNEKVIQIARRNRPRRGFRSAGIRGGAPLFSITSHR
jgi:hypothetical protein